MTWTLFWDMHSGGGQKEDFHKLYIEAPEEEAISVFYSRFGHNPHRVTCTCCGSDYSIQEYETLEEATAYHRNDHLYQWRDKTRGVTPLEEYLEEPGVAVIRAEEINDWEKENDPPTQGYVWQD